MQPLRFIDKQLNGITTYRLVLYGLLAMTGASLALAFLDLLSFTITSMLVLLGLLLIVAASSNLLLARSLRITPSTESTYITALILYMILPPVTSASHALAVALAALAAMASKYLLTFRGSHIFNPAAFGLAAVTLTGLSSSMWWVGSSVMLPFTVIFGLLVVRKIRRFSLVSLFIATSLAVMVGLALADGREVATTITMAFTSWPMIFLGCIMLTEPATLPARQKQRLAFGTVVAILFAAHPSVGPLSTTPEVALLLGNLFTLAVSPAKRMTLRLKKKTMLSEHVYDFAFETIGAERQPDFKAGQYAELTLPLIKNDDRGNRRSFTIASAPSEGLVHFGVKFYRPSSSFKQALIALKPGDTVTANRISGDFILPADQKQKLAFIAGGIGMTPFRSHLADLLGRGEQRDITLFYLVSDPNEISYQDVINRAKEELGIRFIPVLSYGAVARANHDSRQWQGHVGRLDATFIRQQIPDYAERTFYISGPNRMVDDTKATLRKLGLRQRSIRTDHFSGY